MADLSTQRLSTIEIFCKAAELGSFARTAVVLGISPSAVSKAVFRLEQRLGVRLFHRTTRSLRLTQEGTLYFERCQQALGDIAEAEVLITQGVDTPTGLLRVSLPAAYSIHVLAPRLPAFMQQYPKIQLELHVSDRFVDLVEENIDVAIRFGNLSDSTLRIRPLQSYRVVTVAAPSYLQQHGTPTTLAELQQHNCIRLLVERTGQPIKCFYRVGQDFLEATVQGSLKVTGADTARILAIQGVGITHLIEFVVQTDLQTGRLQTILEDIEPPVRQAFALYKQRQHTALKVKYFLDFLAQDP
ncbi:MAG: LysR family transcriptional regulator [Cyanobacteria bacterium P01_H01_bin.26]